MSKKTIRKITLIICLTLAIGSIVISTITVAKKTYQKRVATEEFNEPDFYLMQKFSEENVKAAIKFLQKGDSEGLQELIIGNPDVSELMDYADWKSMEIYEAGNLGTGSLMAKPDENGVMDIGDQCAVKVGKTIYTIYIQTGTARYGRTNMGICSIAVTTMKHYVDELELEWEWHHDSKTLLIGDPFIGQEY